MTKIHNFIIALSIPSIPFIPTSVIQIKDAAEVIIPAREGALNVLKAAKKQGVSRVVMTSSVVAVWGGGREGSRMYSESDWTNTDDPDQSIVSNTICYMPL